MNVWTVVNKEMCLLTLLESWDKEPGFLLGPTVIRFLWDICPKADSLHPTRHLCHCREDCAYFTASFLPSAQVQRPLKSDSHWTTTLSRKNGLEVQKARLQGTEKVPVPALVSKALNTDGFYCVYWRQWCCWWHCLLLHATLSGSAAKGFTTVYSPCLLFPQCW